MKKIILTICLFFAVLSVYAKGIRDEMNFTGSAEQSSYAFGMTVGSDLKQAGIEIDYNAFLEGLRASMEDQPTIMDKDQALELVQDTFERAMRKQSAELAAKEDAFLIENATQPGMHRTESGLQYIVLEEGDGPKPAIEDVVKVHYEGSLVNGSVFDSSYERGDPEEIPLEMVIPGWAEGIMLMNVGSKHKIFIPSNMAYGERGAGQVIPPFSTLVFTVELIEILDAAEEEETDWDSSGDSDSED